MFSEVDRVEMRLFVKAALLGWHKPEIPVPAQNKLRIVRNNLNTVEQAPEIALRLATKMAINDCLKVLAGQNEQSAEILTLRYIEGYSRAETSKQLDLQSVNRCKHLCQQAVSQLVEVALSAEQHQRQRQQRKLAAKLPTELARDLIGVGDLCHLIGEQLVADTDVHSIALVGIGGIGKTAICIQSVLNVIQADRFEALVWLRMEGGGMVTADGSIAPLTMERLVAQILHDLGVSQPAQTTMHNQREQLHDYLQTAPTLIIVDNLESAEITNQLITYLSDFLNPSKLLLTTRSKPALNTKLTSIPIPQLGQQAAFALIRQQAHSANCTELATAADRCLQPIVDLVGGNPLAIKLVVRLAADLSLSVVLDDLKQAEIGDIDQLYRRIYQRTWGCISPEARALLAIMPLAASTGITAENMQMCSGLEYGILSDTIRELVAHSLLEVHGTTFERFYAIHSLTKTFLLIDVLDWAQADGGI
ncbi:MAG TPA: hypothetical protein ENJ56_05105 [Anaerolineae bacterium]|nr:hypothetical protein [Anaerolineae bacterium]